MITETSYKSDGGQLEQATAAVLLAVSTESLRNSIPGLELLKDKSHARNV